MTDAEFAAVAASPGWEQAIRAVAESAGLHLPDLLRHAGGSFTLFDRSGFHAEHYAADGTLLAGPAVRDCWIGSSSVDASSTEVPFD